MKTYKIWWPEDKDRIVAQDCFLGIENIKEDFPDVEVTEEFDILTLTGPEEEIEDLIDLIRTTYKEYGRLAVKIDESTMVVTEAVKIPSFSAEDQKSLDRLCSYLAMYKFITTKQPHKAHKEKFDDFIQKFQNFKSMTDDMDEKQKIQKYIDEINNIMSEIQGKEVPVEIRQNKGRGMRRAGQQNRKNRYEKHIEAEYANPYNGGEYWDGDVHVYEVPADESSDDEIEESYKKYLDSEE